MVVEMYRPYLEDTSTVLLAVVSSTTDFENQPIWKLIRENNCLNRTIGVVTKADRIEEDTEAAWQRIIENKSKMHLQYGWYITRSAAQKQLNDGITHKQVLANEKYFFQNHVVWKKFPLKNRLGSLHLRTQMTQVLLDCMKETLPNLQEKAEKLLEEVESQLKGMGERIPESEHERMIALQEKVSGLLQAMKHQYGYTSATDFSQLRDGFDDVANLYAKSKPLWKEFQRTLRVLGRKILMSNYSEKIGSPIPSSIVGVYASFESGRVQERLLASFKSSDMERLVTPSINLIKDAKVFMHVNGDSFAGSLCDDSSESGYRCYFPVTRDQLPSHMKSALCIPDPFTVEVRELSDHIVTFSAIPPSSTDSLILTPTSVEYSYEKPRKEYRERVDSIVKRECEQGQYSLGDTPATITPKLKNEIIEKWEEPSKELGSKLHKLHSDFLTQYATEHFGQFSNLKDSMTSTLKKYLESQKESYIQRIKFLHDAEMTTHNTLNTHYFFDIKQRFSFDEVTDADILKQVNTMGSLFGQKESFNQKADVPTQLWEVATREMAEKKKVDFDPTVDDIISSVVAQHRCAYKRFVDFVYLTSKKCFFEDLFEMSQAKLYRDLLDKTRVNVLFQEKDEIVFKREEASRKQKALQRAIALLNDPDTPLDNLK